MEWLSGAIKWTLANWSEVLGVISAVLVALGAWAKCTKNPDDDAFVAKLMAFFNLIPKSRKK